MPWQWEELLERATVAEIDQVIRGAHWRMDALVWQPCAWQTAHLLNAAGSKPLSAEEIAMLSPATESTGWTAEKLLGRPPLPIDPGEAKPEPVAAPPAAAAPPVPPWLADLTPEERRAKAARGMAMLAQAEALKAAGVRAPSEPS